MRLDMFGQSSIRKVERTFEYSVLPLPDGEAFRTFANILGDYSLTRDLENVGRYEVEDDVVSFNSGKIDACCDEIFVFVFL